MLLRTVVALGVGFLFMACAMGTFWTALFITLVINLSCTLEFCRLKPDMRPVHQVVMAVWSSLVLVVASLVLARGLAAAWLIIVLGAVMIFFAVVAVVQYERRGDTDPWILLRALLFITLPLSVLAPLAQPGPGSDGFPYLLLLIGASWGADTGAIWTGKAIGRRKLAPRISPNKTVEGLVGGLVSAGAVWAGAALVYPPPGSWLQHGLDVLPSWLFACLMLVAGALTASAGVAGDLAFSLFKRQAGLKDYGRIMPGHGGMLDRVDSFIFVAPVVYLLSRF